MTEKGGLCMETVLNKLIFEGKYFEAEKIVKKMSSKEQRDEIMNLAYGSESIAVYSFLRYMTEKIKHNFGWI